jgi:hypothetical protein
MTEAVPLVRLEDIRAANLCLKGSRNWFEAHGFPWSTFLANGIPVTCLEGTADPLALRVAAITRRRTQT